MQSVQDNDGLEDDFEPQHDTDMKSLEDVQSQGSSTEVDSDWSEESRASQRAAATGMRMPIPVLLDPTQSANELFGKGLELTPGERQTPMSFYQDGTDERSFPQGDRRTP